MGNYHSFCFFLFHVFFYSCLVVKDTKDMTANKQESVPGMIDNEWINIFERNHHHLIHFLCLSFLFCSEADYAAADLGAVKSSPSSITNFRGQYDFLSNFYYSPIVCDDLEFPTVEHAFQAAKCLGLEDKKRILDCKSPTIAKRAGRRVPLRPDWESVKVSDSMAGWIFF